MGAAGRYLQQGPERLEMLEADLLADRHAEARNLALAHEQVVRAVGGQRHLADLVPQPRDEGAARCGEEVDARLEPPQHELRLSRTAIPSARDQAAK